MDNLQEFVKKKEHLLSLKEHARHKHIEDIYHQKISGKYLGDFVYGANDGLITTFSVVAGALGASFPTTVVMVLGLANILADGFSMGAGNYLAIRSENDYKKGQRKKEAWEIEHLRPIEVQEIREIYYNKGFRGEELENIIKTITGNKDVWLDDMMKYELGIVEENPENPVKHGLATFVAFIISGTIPLLAFILGYPVKTAIYISIILTAIAMFSVGAFRQLISPVKWYKGGLENLFVGLLAGGAAFVVGDIIEKIIIK